MTKRTLIEKSIAINKFTFLASILILCLLITVSLVCGSIASNIPQSIEKQKTSSLQARLLFVAPSDLIWDENKINQISKLEHVESIFTQDEGYWDAEIEIADKSIYTQFLGAEGSMLPENIIAGKTATLKDFEILIPSNLISTDGTILNGIDYLGQYITVDTLSLTYLDETGNYDPTKTTHQQVKLKVAGVYDVTSQVYLENQIFTTMNTSLYLHKLSNGNIYDYVAPAAERLVLIDNYKNVKNIKTELILNDFIVSDALSFDYTLLYGVQILTTLLCTITLLASFFISYLLISKNLYKKQAEVSLLMVLGYEENAILKITLYQIFKVISVSVLLATLFYYLIYTRINTLLFATLYFPEISLRLIINICIFLFFIPLIAILQLSKHVKQIPIIESLKDVDQ